MVFNFLTDQPDDDDALEGERNILMFTRYIYHSKIQTDRRNEMAVGVFALLLSMPFIILKRGGSFLA